MKPCRATSVLRTRWQAIGKQIDWGGKKRITGVIADFHPRTLHSEIGPLMIDSRRYPGLSFQPGAANSYPANGRRAFWPAARCPVQDKSMPFKEVYGPG